MNELELKKLIRDLAEIESHLWSQRYTKNFSWKAWYQINDDIAELSSQTLLSKLSIKRIFEKLKFNS
jgi:hypothetical protein